MENLEKQILQRYHLESALHRQYQTLQATEEKLPRAKYTIRELQQEKVLYKGSFRAFLDGLSGRRQEKEETLTRRLRQAESEQDALLRLRSSLEQDCQELARELEKLPDREELRSAALADPQTRKLWAERESLLCAQQLLPLLEKLDEALEDYRSQLRGDRMGEIAGNRDRHETSTAHIGWAEQCRPLLQRLREVTEMAGHPVEIGGYFENPACYIVSAAARHNRLDRVNRALEQILQLRRRLTALTDESEA